MMFGRLQYYLKFVKKLDTAWMLKHMKVIPNNYMEMVVRDKRWMKGTIQSIKSLFVLSRKNTLTTYGVLLFPISMYRTHSVINPLLIV